MNINFYISWRIYAILWLSHTADTERNRMKKTSLKITWSRAVLAGLLCLLTLLPLCLSVGAEDVGFSTLFEIDPNTITSVTGGGNEDFTISKKGGTITWNKATNLDGYTGNVITITNGQYLITDVNKKMINSGAVAISADVLFSAFPTKKSSSSADSPDPASDNFKSQSILSWITNYKNYDGVRIDSEGNLYYGSGLASSLNYKIEKNKWYNLKVIYSLSNGKLEIYVNDNRIGIGSSPIRVAEGDSLFRVFDGTFNYTCKVKDINISTTNEKYLGGLTKEPSADFISYQTSKPDKNGKFDIRIIAGLNELTYQNFGYKVIALTENAGGETVAIQTEGSDTKAYDAVYGGGKSYSVKDNFGYNYACLATITGVDSSSDYTELVVFPYTTSVDGKRIYGAGISLVYRGNAENGYPILDVVKNDQTTVAITDDTYVYGYSPNQNYGSSISAVVRNPGNDTKTYYRAAYFKTTFTAEQVEAIQGQEKAYLSLYISSINTDRQTYPLELYATSTDWTETTLTYKNRETLAKKGELISTVSAAEQIDECFIQFDICDYLKKQKPAADGTLTVSFCVKQEDGHTASDATASAETTFYTKETTTTWHQPFILLKNSLYGHETTNVKSLNEGYEPLAYAEYLVDMWFDDLVDKVYPKDSEGNLIYHDIDAFDPNGYAATEATGDFTQALMWKNGRPWSETVNTTKNDPFNGYYLSSLSGLTKNKFARTLSTLGTSVGNRYLDSSYQKTTEYDIYGGITNAGFTGAATGFFHTEKHGDRTYIIDPLGNPYFAMGMNTVCLGDSTNHKTYSLAKYGDEETYYNEISASLKGMGINTCYGGDSAQLLAVENGLSSVASVSSMGVYMSKLGRGQIHEGVFPYNNTINVFDPDYPATVNVSIPQKILANGYHEMDRLLGYTTDNELPSGNDILFRYLTLDPDVPDSVFSYHTAWTWFSRRMNMVNPTINTLLASPDFKQLNSEFLSFLYSNYFRISRDAIELADPNHMYLGSRVNGSCYDDEGFHRAAGAFLDLITVNLYSGLNPAPTRITNFYRNAGIPYIVTEFFAKGLDAIDANGYKLATSTGAGIMVYTQEERAAYFQHYVLALLESKACVGWTWYRYRDNDQALWSVGDMKNLRMLHVTYGQVTPQAHTFMDDDGKVWHVDELPGVWKDDYTEQYDGESIASNQNVNKGIYNCDFTSVVTVYHYNADGTLDVTSDPYSFGSYSYKVKDPASENVKDGDVLTALKDDTKTFTIGTVTAKDGSYTKTVLTVYKGKYIALANSFKELSDNLIGIINFLDANANK